MQNFLSLWLNAGVQITHGSPVQRPRLLSILRMYVLKNVHCDNKLHGHDSDMIRLRSLGLSFMPSCWASLLHEWKLGFNMVKFHWAFLHLYFGYCFFAIILVNFMTRKQPWSDPGLETLQTRTAAQSTWRTFNFPTTQWVRWSSQAGFWGDKSPGDKPK